MFSSTAPTYQFGSNHSLTPASGGEQAKIRKLSKKLALESMENIWIYNQELLQELENFWCNILQLLNRPSLSNPFSLPTRNIIKTAINEYLADLFFPLKAAQDDSEVNYRKQLVQEKINVLKKYLLSSFPGGPILTAKEATILLEPIRHQSNKIIRKYEDIFNNAFEILEDSQKQLTQQSSIGEQKPQTDTNVINTLTNALKAFENELFHSDLVKKDHFLLNSQATSIALSVENLVVKLMDPKTTPKAKNNAIFDFQHSVSKISKKRKLLFLLGAFIVGAAIAATLYFCPIFFLAALFPITTKIGGTLMFACAVQSAASIAMLEWNFYRHPRPNLFFTEPVLNKNSVTAVVDAAKAVAKTPVMKS